MKRLIVFRGIVASNTTMQSESFILHGERIPLILINTTAKPALFTIRAGKYGYSLTMTTRLRRRSAGVK